MKQLVSHYMMPYDREEDITKIIKDLKLEGIENLVYGEEPAKHPVPSLTVGCHLAYWPDWMNFYLGRSDLYKKDFPTEKSLIDYFGGTTVEAWERRIRNNIRAALAEKPAYLVWHVADCSVEEIWTRRFRYSSREVLKAAAEVYSAVADEVPQTVQALFENIFWPGLYTLEPEDVDYFFSCLPGNNNRYHAGYGAPYEYQLEYPDGSRWGGLCLQHRESAGQYEGPHQRHPPVLLHFRQLPADPCGPAAGKDYAGSHRPPHHQHRPAPALYDRCGEADRGYSGAGIPDP